MLDSFRRRFREAKASRVEFDSTGFRCTAGRGVFRDPLVEQRSWAEIQGVTVFKADAYITDCICLLFEGSAPMLAVEETMDGYREFVDYLPQALPGTQPFEEWFMIVAFPAFDPNPTVIYRR